MSSGSTKCHVGRNTWVRNRCPSSYRRRTARRRVPWSASQPPMTRSNGSRPAPQEDAVRPLPGRSTLARRDAGYEVANGRSTGPDQLGAGLQTEFVAFDVGHRGASGSRMVIRPKGQCRVALRYGTDQPRSSPQHSTGNGLSNCLNAHLCSLTVHQPPLFENGCVAKPPPLLYRGSG